MKTFILNSLFFIASFSAFATGPSEIISEMIPIAVSSDGSVLCKSKEMSNEMGARLLMPYTFGWVIVAPNGQLKKYAYINFEGDNGMDSDGAYAKLEKLEAHYEKEMNLALAQKKLTKVLSKYEFKTLSAKHKIGKTFSYKSFRNQYPAVDENCTQTCLKEVKSRYKPERLKIEYQIGNLLFLENSYFHDIDEGESEEVGSNFQCHPDDITEGYYDDFIITGIIVLGKNTSANNQGDMEIGGFYKMQVLKLEKEGFGIQVGGYSNYAAVLERLLFLESKWFKGTMVAVGELNGEPYYRIVMGPMKTKEEAISYCNNLKANYKLKSAFVVNLADLN